MKKVLGFLSFMLVGYVGLWIAGHVIDFLVTLSLGYSLVLLVSCFALIGIVFTRLAVSK